MDQTERLAGEIEGLKAEVARLNQHRFVRLHNSVPRLLAFRFAGGLMFGLGTVLGGSILLSLLVLMLGSIDFIPVIGEWAARIATEMETALAVCRTLGRFSVRISP